MTKFVPLNKSSEPYWEKIFMLSSSESAYHHYMYVHGGNGSRTTPGTHNVEVRFAVQPRGGSGFTYVDDPRFKHSVSTVFGCTYYADVPYDHAEAFWLRYGW